MGESSFQRLNLALLFASAFNLILFLQNAATGGEFAFCNHPYHVLCSAISCNGVDLFHGYAVDESSVISYSAFYVTILALGATVWTAWGGYGKNSEVGLSLKRVGPMPALKVQFGV